VLQRGVNDSYDAMQQLVRRLSCINIHPYYVYVCDMVAGIEDLRTNLATALDIEKRLRGSTAGFNTPTFVCDLPGGGGKRCAHSYEYYNRDTGIAVYVAPSVKPGQFLFFDPLHSLSEESRARWADEREQERMIEEARNMALAGRCS
jgi:lysine 2,3-aminomutase